MGLQRYSSAKEPADESYDWEGGGVKILHLELPLTKAEYLLHYTTATGESGDKRKFWYDILGFRSPETLRTALLKAVTIDKLEADVPNIYGNLYRIIITLTTPAGSLRRVRTVWIVRFGEDVARFVTAYPEQRKE